MNNGRFCGKLCGSASEALHENDSVTLKSFSACLIG